MRDMNAMDKRDREELLETLAKVGGRQVKDDEVTFEGHKVILPTQFEGRLEDAVSFLDRLRQQREEEHRFSRTFKYRPWDGAYALDQVMKQFTGTGGLGKATFSFFTGKQPPEKRTINVGPNQTANVPWGMIQVPIFDGTLMTNTIRDPELGMLFQLIIDAPKKYEAAIEGFFQAIESYFEAGNSIYQGQAIDAKDDPNFIDTDVVDPSKIVYSRNLREDLDSLIWRFVRERESLKEQGIPFKRAVVLFGKYGTGKTETANTTAKYCVENGVTFIKVRAGKDNLGEAMQTAKLLQPAVVFFEDVDTVADADQGDQTITRLLDLFDGMDAKANDVMVILTTNHINKIHKGMMRPGRIDAAIEIGLLDADGVQQLAENRLGVNNIDPETDWDAVYAACEGYTPAFVNEALKRVFLYHKNEGRYSTRDFVSSAEGLRSQYNLMEDARESAGQDRFEVVLDRVIRDAVQDAKILDKDGDEIGNYGMRVNTERDQVVS